MRLLPSWTGYCRGDIGVDLGAATTVLCARGGELISEPSVLAVDAHTSRALAAGNEAIELLGRVNITAIRPIKDGAIVDLQRTAEMLHHLIAKLGNGRSRPRVIASTSSAMSVVQRRAVAEACAAAGAREVRLLARPIATALGCGLPIHEPIGTMVLDIGVTTSEVAMLSMQAIVASRSIRTGGQEFDQRIVAHLRHTHRALIDDYPVEHINAQIGTLPPDAPDAPIDILARDLTSGTPKSVTLSSREIRDLFEPPISRVIEATADTLARTPPQLAADVIDHGITLTGGCSLLPGIAQRICLETGIPAFVADSPQTCTAIGAAKSCGPQ